MVRARRTAALLGPTARAASTTRAPRSRQVMIMNTLAAPEMVTRRHPNGATTDLRALLPPLHTIPIGVNE
ncbi:unnamed protein product [Pieris brassicae]|uniref:Uncharacterized protein n=1 Tax=Pieris brassicae TaxID=7116 RepID=A0A9P0T7B0_PIEBR|nr:unnamed protein product [Pieris brassicae]